ncbi:MAG: LysR substrate-binding domain-containing protein [Azospirillaceae bacterium]
MSDLGRVHLNGLRAVEAVARLGTLARAAAELGVSPGAVSQQVIKTERQLGRALFERRAGGLVPTAAARPVLERLTAGFDELSRAVALATARPSNALTVTVAPVLAAKWLVPRLARFTAAHPALRVRIDASLGIVDLDRDDIDLGIRVGDGGWPGVRAEKLMSHRIFPVAAPALAARLREPADLAHVPIVRDHGTMIAWSTWLAPHGLDESLLGPGPVFSDAALGLDAAIAGQGVLLAWETLAADALADGRLVAPFPGPPVDSGLGYWLVTSATRRPGPRVRAFAAWVKAEMEVHRG